MTLVSGAAWCPPATTRARATSLRASGKAARLRAPARPRRRGCRARTLAGVDAPAGQGRDRDQPPADNRRRRRRPSLDPVHRLPAEDGPDREGQVVTASTPKPPQSRRSSRLPSTEKRTPASRRRAPPPERLPCRARARLRQLASSCVEWGRRRTAPERRSEQAKQQDLADDPCAIVPCRASSSSLSAEAVRPMKENDVPAAS